MVMDKKTVDEQEKMTVGRQALTDRADKLIVYDVNDSVFNMTIGQFRKSQIFNDTIRQSFLERKDDFVNFPHVFSTANFGISLQFNSRTPFFLSKDFNDVKTAFLKGHFVSATFYKRSFDGKNREFFCRVGDRTLFTELEKATPINNLFFAICLTAKSFDASRLTAKSFDVVRAVQDEQLLSDEEARFKALYGRLPFIGEPSNGFRIPVFQPTPTDDGKCVLLGKIVVDDLDLFSPSKTVVFDGNAFSFGTGKPVDAKMFSHLTRDAFLERLKVLDARDLESISKVEQYFRRCLPNNLLGTFIEKTKNRHIDVEKNWVTGTDFLLAHPSKKYSDSFEPREVYVLAEAPTQENFNAFVGRIATLPVPGVLLKPQVGFTKNKIVRGER